MKICPMCMSYMRFYSDKEHFPAYHCDYCNYDTVNNNKDTITNLNPQYNYKIILK